MCVCFQGRKELPEAKLLFSMFQKMVITFFFFFFSSLKQDYMLSKRLRQWLELHSFPKVSKITPTPDLLRKSWQTVNTFATNLRHGLLCSFIQFIKREVRKTHSWSAFQYFWVNLFMVVWRYHSWTIYIYILFVSSFCICKLFYILSAFWLHLLLAFPKIPPLFIPRQLMFIQTLVFTWRSSDEWFLADGVSPFIHNFPQTLALNVRPEILWGWRIWGRKRHENVSCFYIDIFLFGFTLLN